mmetsp:Transcript_37280/g.57185  ORF Transcript_37280/g.57185 Transcript_37280/m.57185 type:complete len:108 (+) Transcript_37280:1385-1708(+)
MFTLPTKVELQVVIDGTEIDRVDIVIPGGHVNTLTSASKLIKEYPFSRRQHYFERYADDQRIDIYSKDDLTQRQKDRLKNEVNWFENQKMDVEGAVFVRAEWEGSGD